MKKLLILVLFMASLSVVILPNCAYAQTTIADAYTAVITYDDGTKVPIKGFSQNVSHATKTTCGPIVISKELDTITPTIVLDCISGRHLNHVYIDFFNSIDSSTPTTYFQIKLTDVVVTSIDMTDTSDVYATVPAQEVIKLSYGQIEWRTPKGSAFFDTVHNKAK